MTVSRDEKGNPLQKHTLHLFEGEYEKLGVLFPGEKPARVVRHLVHDLIVRMQGERPDVKVDFTAP